MAKNSAPSNTNNPAPLKKVRIKNNTECTGFFEVTTINAEAIATSANI
jgi:hypothetical protein